MSVGPMRASARLISGRTILSDAKASTRVAPSPAQPDRNRSCKRVMELSRPSATRR
jgi:hypothetical protein